MPFCSRCGTKLDDGTKFCFACGQPQPQGAVQISAPVQTPAPTQASPAIGNIIEEFTNNSGDYCAFTDNGIVCRNTVKNRFYPYGSIEKIGFSLGSLDITGKANGENKAFIYVASGKDQKTRLKDLVSFAQSQSRTAVRTEVVEIEPKKSKEQAEADYRAYLREKQAKEYAELHKEIRMRCNVCGHIFCYTKQDLKDNQTNAALTALSGVGTIAAAFGGTRYDMYEQGKLADRNASKVIDYSRCPSCRSTNLTQLSDDEMATPHQNTSVPASSPIEDLKKYKELLDMGIITQEEFDAKKKQLLNL